VVEDPLADACCTGVVHLNSAEESRVCRKNEESGNSGEAGNQHVSVIRVSGCDAEGGNHCRSNRLGSIETGDVVDVDWLPSRGTFVFYNGQLMGNPVRGKALYDAVLSIWLGNNSLEEKLREGLLSLPKEKTEN